MSNAHRVVVVQNKRSPHYGKTEEQVPVRFKNGMFALAERFPVAGRNKASRYIFVRDLNVALDWVRSGTHVIWTAGTLTKARAQLCNRDFVFA